MGLGETQALGRAGRASRPTYPHQNPPARPRGKCRIMPPAKLIRHRLTAPHPFGAELASQLCLICLTPSAALGDPLILRAIARSCLRRQREA